MIKPGWALKFEDGEWLAPGYQHWSASKEPRHAYIVESLEEAERLAAEIQNELGTMSIIEAWEPLVDTLQHRISELEEANKVSPEKLWKVTNILEEALLDLKSHLR